MDCLDFTAHILKMLVIIKSVDWFAWADRCDQIYGCADGYRPCAPLRILMWCFMSFMQVMSVLCIYVF